MKTGAKRVFFDLCKKGIKPTWGQYLDSFPKAWQAGGAQLLFSFYLSCLSDGSEEDPVTDDKIIKAMRSAHSKSHNENPYIVSITRSGEKDFFGNDVWIAQTKTGKMAFQM